MGKGYKEYRIASIFLMVIFAAALFACNISPLVNLKHFTYSGEKTITITGYTGPGGKVRIPAAIDGKRVVAIGDNVFENKSLTSIIIPNSVTEIGEFAFSHNQLTNVTIPKNVTFIGASAFYHNQLNSVTIPKNVTEIGGFVFSDNQLTSIIIPDRVTFIGNSAFSNNQLNSITIPDSVTFIGDSAFYHNQLTSVIIPDKVISISEGAFYGNQLTSVILPNGTRLYRIYSKAFSNNNLTSVIIPNNVTAIYSNAFSNNRLTSVTIGAMIELTTGKWSSFGDGFEHAYNDGGKLAGTYTRPDIDSTVWTGSNVTLKENDNREFSENSVFGKSTSQESNDMKEISTDNIDLLPLIYPANYNVMDNFLCGIHNQKLHIENIEIKYGYIDSDIQYEKLKEKYFPYCNDSVLGGCVIPDRSPHYKSSFVCNECNKERDKVILR